MAIVFSNDAETTLLDRLLGASASETWQCRLFKGDVTPAAAHTAATYSAVEADFGGYAGQNLTDHGNWPAAASVSGKAQSQFSAEVPFSFGSTGASNSVYGFFITDSSGRLIMAERFAAGPYAMVNLGDTIKVRPTLRLFDPNS